MGVPSRDSLNRQKSSQRLGERCTRHCAKQERGEGLARVGREGHIRTPKIIVVLRKLGIMQPQCTLRFDNAPGGCGSAG